MKKTNWGNRDLYRNADHRGKGQIAVALQYAADSGSVPTVSAMGERLIAREMAKVAQRYGVPIVSDRRLANELSKLEEEQEIPEELFLDVAKTLVNTKPKS